MSRAQDIEQSAALWVLRREEPSWTPADQERLDLWLGESDAHKVAFWRLQHGWREADRIASIGSFEPPRHNWLREQWLKPLAFAASLALVVLAFALHGPDWSILTQDAPRPERFATAIGGHKIVQLPDGSRVELNTDTVIQASVGDKERGIWLERGEAYFDVAKDPDRQFVVHAGTRTVTAIGTKFSVRRSGNQVIVAVLEGRVRVDDVEGDAATRSATISRGDMAIAEGASTLVAAKSEVAVEEKLAWRDGLLLFDGTTLGEAATEFNRYNQRRLIIADPAIAQTRIGGSFQAKNVDAFARLLEQAYGLDVDIEAENISVSAGS